MGGYQTNPKTGQQDFELSQTAKIWGGPMQNGINQYIGESSTPGHEQNLASAWGNYSLNASAPGIGEKFTPKMDEQNRIGSDAVNDIRYLDKFRRR